MLLSIKYKEIELYLKKKKKAQLGIESIEPKFLSITI